MNTKEILGFGAIGLVVVAAAAMRAKETVSPAPLPGENVGLVMLANAMDRVEAAVHGNGTIHQLSCTSLGNENVTCDAIGSVVYRVSFANETRVPAFELSGQRRIDGKLYVNAFNRGTRDIAARDVDRFTSAFNGRATVQPESPKKP